MVVGGLRSTLLSATSTKPAAFISFFDQVLVDPVQRVGVGHARARARRMVDDDDMTPPGFSALNIPLSKAAMSSVSRVRCRS